METGTTATDVLRHIDAMVLAVEEAAEVKGFGRSRRLSTSRDRAAVYEAIAVLESAGILIPLSTGKRNRWWEAVGLLDLVARLEAGQ